MQEIGKFDVEISVIPNGLEKYMAFTIDKNLVFIYSMQFMNFGLYVLVKNLQIMILNIYLKNLMVNNLSIWIYGQF